MQLYKKRSKNGGEFTFIWIAVNRRTNKVVDFEIGDRSRGTYLSLAFRLEQKYNIEHLCTDDYSVYKYYKISKCYHTTKSETELVESKNSIIKTLFG